MNFRTVAVGTALAIFGLGAAVGIGLAANAISGDSVGLSADPLSAGGDLAPRPASVGDLRAARRADALRWRARAARRAERREELAEQREERADETEDRADDAAEPAAPVTEAPETTVPEADSESSGQGRGRGRGRGRSGGDSGSSDNSGSGSDD